MSIRSLISLDHFHNMRRGNKLQLHETEVTFVTASDQSLDIVGEIKCHLKSMDIHGHGNL